MQHFDAPGDAGQRHAFVSSFIPSAVGAASVGPRAPGSVSASGRHPRGQDRVRTELAVETVRPIGPGTHTITFAAKGVRGGDWENCAEMESNAIPAGTG